MSLYLPHNFYRENWDRGKIKISIFYKFLKNLQVKMFGYCISNFLRFEIIFNNNCFIFQPVD